MPGDPRARDILQRINADQLISGADLGYVLPKAGRELDGSVRRCHETKIACVYRFRGELLMWIASTRGYSFEGISRVPPLAGWAGWLGITTCKQCARHHRVIMTPTGIIFGATGPPPVFTTVAA